MIDSLGFLLTILTKWLPSHIAGLARSRPRPTHILFCTVDHWEPGTGSVDAEAENTRVQELLARYPPLADKHADASGRRPSRTWFFPPHYHRAGNLRGLVSLCEQGYGEIELHLHHGKTTPDTADNLHRTIKLCIQDYARFGIFGREGGERRYAFIHGDWALNNSLPQGRYCGVDTELAVLKETGCYADFTFPSCMRNNPRQINSIYYADTTLRGRRAFSTGRPAEAGTGGVQKGLLIVQGPVRPVFVDGRLTFGDSISNRRHPTPRLLDAWVGTSIHLAGRPDMVIVKVHTHGAISGETVLGRPMDRAFDHLESRYNDGRSYRLHYVTARELYNIIRATEAGESGDPSQYLDLCVKAPSYDSSPSIMEASAELKKAVAATYPI